MFCKPLMLKEAKGSYKLFIIFWAVLAVYNIVIIYMFDPELAKTLKEFELAMPQVMAAFGMNFSGTTLVEFVSSYLFGFLMVLFPMVYEIMLANRLVARYVDRGSMACLLATPNKRLKIIASQAIFLIVNVTLLLGLSMAVTLVFSEMMFPRELDYGAFLMLYFGAWCLHMAVSGFAFLMSVLFNDSKYAYMAGAGVPVFFYIIQMLANAAGDKLEWLKYTTFFSLFSPDLLIQMTNRGLLNILILLAAGLLSYGGALLIFDKRNFSI